MNILLFYLFLLLLFLLHISCWLTKKTYEIRNALHVSSSLLDLLLVDVVIIIFCAAVRFSTAHKTARREFKSQTDNTRSRTAMRLISTNSCNSTYSLAGTKLWAFQLVKRMHVMLNLVLLCSLWHC